MDICDYDYNPSRSHTTGTKLYQKYIISRFAILDFCLLSLQVKNKPNCGIAPPAFILGADVITNNLFLTLEPKEPKKTQRKLKDIQQQAE